MELVPNVSPYMTLLPPHPVEGASAPMIAEDAHQAPAIAKGFTAGRKSIDIMMTILRMLKTIPHRGYQVVEREQVEAADERAVRERRAREEKRLPKVKVAAGPSPPDPLYLQLYCKGGRLSRRRKKKPNGGRKMMMTEEE